MIRLILAVVLILLGTASHAHELRPGYLEIRQSGPDAYDIRFKVPARGDLRLSLHPRFPETCTQPEAARVERAGDALMELRSIICPGGLDGKPITIDGLASTFTDVIVRISQADGSVQAARLTPDQPTVVITGSPSWTATARTYFYLGVEHILFGIDHLLFVFALLLLIRDPWMLVKAITAFTVAHSITLAAASLGWANVPQAPVEAVIALSIMFVAAEIIRQARGQLDLAARSPWIVAFLFGLLHGFGFGGALKEIGLPQNDVPLALLTFNLGVEVGQLMFIAAVLVIKVIADRLVSPGLPWLRGALAYATGCIAAFWFVERMSALG